MNTETQTELTGSQISMTCEVIVSQNGTITIIPNNCDPLNTDYFGRGRVDIKGNMTVGAGIMDWAAIFFGSGNPGKVRLIGNDRTFYVATTNPEAIDNPDGSKSYTAPTGYGDMVVNNLIVDGNINIKRPVYKTMTAAKKVLSPGEEFITPAGNVKQIPHV